MEEEERLRSKYLYKLFIILLKYIPVFVAIAYVLNTLLCYTDIDCPVLSNIAGMSFLPWLFMYIATYVFKFCTYHRLLLYYVLLDDVLSTVDYYINIPCGVNDIITVHLVLIGILVLALLINHVKTNKRKAITDSF